MSENLLPEKNANVPNLSSQPFGNYLLLRQLEQGDFADSYLAEHLHQKTEVTVKVLKIRAIGEDAQRFLTHARALSLLKHPNICSVIDFGLQDDIPFLVTGYTTLRSLRQIYPQGMRLPEQIIVSYVKQVATALQYAHDQGIFHGNLQQDNMLLSEEREVLLSDFGLAHMTYGLDYQVTQEVAKTVIYTAPEQLQGKRLPTSDEYALGIVTYEWICGNPPFQGTYVQIREQHLSAPVPSLCRQAPELSPFIEEVVMLALQKDPQQRFASVRAFANALEQSSPLPTILRSEPGNPHPLLTYPNTTPVPLLQTHSLPLSEEQKTITPALSSSQLPTHSLPLLEEQKNITPALSSLPTSQLPSPPARFHFRITRRVLIAAGGIGLVALSGIAALALTQQHPPIATVPVKRDDPPPSATLPMLPQGSTITTYRGHTGQVFVVAWSPDGTRVASAAQDSSIQIWDAATGGNVLLYQGHYQNVYALTWSPDGTRIVSGGVDKTAQIWDAKTGETLLTYTGHTKQVNTLDWSPDSTRIISGSNDDNVHVWEASSGKLLYSHQHSKPPRAVIWSPDGKLIASGGDDHQVQVLDAATGELLYTFGDHTDRIWVMTWSPDSQRIASGGGDGDRTVRVWRVDGNGTAFVFTGHSHEVTAVSWSPTSPTHIVSGSLYTLQIWEADTGVIECTYAGHSDHISIAKWSPQGPYIASGSTDQTVQIWQGL